MAAEEDEGLLEANEDQFDFFGTLDSSFRILNHLLEMQVSIQYKNQHRKK